MARPGPTNACLSLNDAPQAAAQAPDLDLSHGAEQQDRLSRRIQNQTVVDRRSELRSPLGPGQGQAQGSASRRPGMEGMEVQDTLYGRHPNSVVTDRAGKESHTALPLPGSHQLSTTAFNFRFLI